VFFCLFVLLPASKQKLFLYLICTRVKTPNFNFRNFLQQVEILPDFCDKCNTPIGEPQSANLLLISDIVMSQLVRENILPKMTGKINTGINNIF